MPPGLPPRPATPAGIYNALLGGKDNYAADRDTADQLAAMAPTAMEAAANNRAFLARAAAWAAGQGIRQFLDLGCGYPCPPDTHESAGQDARTVYVDNDPFVVSHVRALLRGPGITAVDADLADDGTVMAACEADGWDPGQPGCVILGLVLQYFDTTGAREAVARYVSRLATGSVVVISCWHCGDDEIADRLIGSYPAGQIYQHGRGDVASFLSGLEVAGPITAARAWRPGWDPVKVRSRPVGIVAGVGVKG